MTTPFVIAVIGAGPSGIYAAEALVQQADVPVQVLVIDRLPVPFGLVRYGVAPDHPSIRSVRTTLERTLARDEVTFLGDVMIGRDLTVAELSERVDACVFAFGAGSSRRLEIPGEDAIGSVAAADFVAWYTGHPEVHPEQAQRPDHQRHPAAQIDRPEDQPAMPALLDGLRSAVVIGAGNVALDVTRILIKRADELASTDMADGVLQALATSEVTDVHLLARRGPSETTMTTKEVRELGRIPDCTVIVHPADLDLDAEDAQATGRIAQRNMVEFRSWATDGPRVGASRRIHLHFWTAATELRTTGGRVSEVVLTDTRPGHHETSTLDAQLAVRAIGYRGIALAGVPFDHRTGRVPHDEGRVLDTDQGLPPRPVPGSYVTGWVKRGPTGVIGTNKSDAVETVQSLLHDIDEGELVAAHPHGLRSVLDLLALRGITPWDLDAWQRIDHAEVDHGEASGRDRATLAHRSELLAAARGVPATAPAPTPASHPQP